MHLPPILRATPPHVPAGLCLNTLRSQVSTKALGAGLAVVVLGMMPGTAAAMPGHEAAMTGLDLVTWAALLLSLVNIVFTGIGGLAALGGTLLYSRTTWTIGRIREQVSSTSEAVADRARLDQATADDLEHHRVAIDNVKGDVVELRGEVRHGLQAIRDELNGTRAQVGDHRADITRLHSELGDVREDLTTLSGKVGSLSVEVGELRRDVSQVSADTTKILTILDSGSRS